MTFYESFEPFFESRSKVADVADDSDEELTDAVVSACVDNFDNQDEYEDLANYVDAMYSTQSDDFRTQLIVKATARYMSLLKSTVSEGFLYEDTDEEATDSNAEITVNNKRKNNILSIIGKDKDNFGMVIALGMCEFGECANVPEAIIDFNHGGVLINPDLSDNDIANKLVRIILKSE